MCPACTGRGLHVPAPGSGVTIDSVEVEYNGLSCTSGRRLGHQDVSPNNSSLNATAGAACAHSATVHSASGGVANDCCATSFVAGKWGLPF